MPEHALEARHSQFQLSRLHKYLKSNMRIKLQRAYTHTYTYSTLKCSIFILEDQNNKNVRRRTRVQSIGTYASRAIRTSGLKVRRKEKVQSMKKERKARYVFDERKILPTVYSRRRKIDETNFARRQHPLRVSCHDSSPDTVVTL